MSKVVIQGNASGTGNFTIAAPNSNTDRTLTLPDATGTLDRLDRAGNVLQVVQTTKTDTFSTTSQSFVDVTGLSVSITPTSTASKILVMCNIMFGPSSHADMRLLRNSTNIAIGDAAGNRTQGMFHTYMGFNNGNFSAESVGMNWLDSPATTSSTTYKIQIAHPYSASYNTNINRVSTDQNASYDGRGVSTITLMEIAQ